MARRKIDNVLEECLSALLQGRLSIEECKARYPDLSQELESLLRTVLEVSSAYQVDPSPDFARRVRLRLLQAAGRRPTRPRRAVWGVWRWASTALGATVALALLVLLSTTLLKGDDSTFTPSISVVIAQTEKTRANLEALESALREGQPPQPEVIRELRVATSQLAATLAEADDIPPEEVALVVEVVSDQQTLLTEARDQLSEESLEEADEALAKSEEILQLVGVTPSPSPTPTASPSPTPTPEPTLSPTPELTPTPSP